MKSKIQTNPWILKLNDELIGEYPDLLAAMDASKKYDESIRLFDFEFYYVLPDGEISKVPMI